jgi:hypothetical protein
VPPPPTFRADGERLEPTVDPLTVTYIILAAAGIVGLSFFAVWILAPAWTSYGRTWERFAAAALSFFALAALVGTGIVIGLILLWNWDWVLNLLGINAIVR